MRITRLGHACLLVETDSGARLLLDPGGFSTGFVELTDLDAVLVTHAHPDHLDVERLPLLLGANDGAVLLAEPETADQLRGAGIEAGALHPGEGVDIRGTAVRAVGGEHATIHADVPTIGNVGLLVDDGDNVLLHPGDSYAVTPEGVDVLAVPLSAPWCALKETVEFVRAVAPGAAVPVHDFLLGPVGRGVYLTRVQALSPDGTVWHDPDHGVAVEIG